MPEDNNGTQSNAQGRFPVSEFRFEDIKLQAGERVQLELLRTHARYYTTAIGYVPSLSVLVRTPVANGLAIPVEEEAPVVLRAFSGVIVFAFAAEVMRVRQAPFPYLHLSFPARVRGAVIRRSERVKCAIPMSLHNLSQGASAHALEGTAVNIGIGGALIETGSPLGQPDDVIRLQMSFSIAPVDHPVTLTLYAALQAIREVEGVDQRNRRVFRCGIEFRDLHPSETIVLQNLVYQSLAENHQSIV